MQIFLNDYNMRDKKGTNYNKISDKQTLKP